jgi:hypothetical protein
VVFFLGNAGIISRVAERDGSRCQDPRVHLEPPSHPESVSPRVDLGFALGCSRVDDAVGLPRAVLLGLYALVHGRVALHLAFTSITYYAAISRIQTPIHMQRQAIDIHAPNIATQAHTHMYTHRYLCIYYTRAYIYYIRVCVYYICVCVHYMCVSVSCMCFCV